MKTLPFRLHISCFIFLLLAWSPLALGQSLCEQENLRDLPVLAKGRIRPLGVHAAETLKMITGKSHRRQAAALYCQLSFHLPGPALTVRVDHVELEKFLNLAESEKSTLIEPLLAREEALLNELQILTQKKQDKKSYGKALNRLIASLQAYRAIIDGRDWMIPLTTTGDEKDWVPLTEFRSREVFADQKAEIAAIGLMGATYRKNQPGTLPTEIVYDRLNLISHKVWLALLALVLVFAVQNKPLKNQFQVGLLASGFILAVGVTDIVFRVLISKRGPVTNMYETVLWVGLGMLLFAMILAVVKNRPVYFLFGLAGMLLSSFMNRFAPSMVDPGIHPLVPVLRDNFWLSTHVTTVTISYAAFALSWLIGNYYMVMAILNRKKVKGETAKTGDLNDLAYAAVKIGVVLLAAGVILGGVWADYSWGRFWGWDPKETWSLIALLTYAAVLHGRYAGWINPKIFLPVIALCFLTILMAWFGVNYILAAGLHSYGFSENGAIFLGSIFTLQFLILGLYLQMGHRSASPASR